MPKRQTRKKVRTVPPFGDLVHVVSDLWERPVEIVIFGSTHTLPLQVTVAETDGLEENQVRAFAHFQKRGDRMLRDAEKELLNYYRTVCTEYRSRLGITRPDDSQVPLISTTKELSKLLKPESLYFRYANPRPTFGLLFQSTWEVEHGIAVKFENGKVSKIGFQDIVL